MVSKIIASGSRKVMDYSLIFSQPHDAHPLQPSVLNGSNSTIKLSINEFSGNIRKLRNKTEEIRAASEV
jgi:hypothetical protein